jgi:Ca-activated chloride channel family protein
MIQARPSLAATAALTTCLFALAACDSAPTNFRASRESLAISPQVATIANVSPIIQTNGEQYPEVQTNKFLRADEKPVSTFSIDVDTAAYSNIRRKLTAGALPPPESVRVEEMINYFDYAYEAPRDSSVPFATSVSIVPAPWSEDRLLLHIGIKGYDTPPTIRPRANLVLLLDVSGSMSGPDRLDLVKQSIRLMLNRLDDDDSVAIVTYAGRSAVALNPTPARDRTKILTVLDNLRSGGSTAGAQGIATAYELAQQEFDPQAINRVILATDGDFNVGVSNADKLERIIAAKRKTGIYLSVLTVGQGNLNDRIAQALAQTGNGTAAHIDSLMEARKVLDDELASTLFPIANDVKIQIEFNPAHVTAYRLIGYETRMLRRDDFANDRIDAGEIGSGHTVTALYEIVPASGQPWRTEPLRYQPDEDIDPTKYLGSDRLVDEYAFLKIRYKTPGEPNSQLTTRPVVKEDRAMSIAEASGEVRFAVAVAAFGQRLRSDPDVEALTYADIVNLAQPARGDDPYGYRAEFIQLVRTAETLSGTELSDRRYCSWIGGAFDFLEAPPYPLLSHDGRDTRAG